MIVSALSNRIRNIPLGSDSVTSPSWLNFCSSTPGDLLAATTNGNRLGLRRKWFPTRQWLLLLLMMWRWDWGFGFGWNLRVDGVRVRVRVRVRVLEWKGGEWWRIGWRRENDGEVNMAFGGGGNGVRFWCLFCGWRRERGGGKGIGFGDF